MSEFGKQLAHFRRAAKMTQGDLAEKLGISKSAVSMYETGNREPDLDLLEEIADTFHVSVDDLLGITNSDTYINNDPELTEYLLTLRERPEMRMLFRLSENATREDVETTIRILEALRKPGE